MKLPAQVEVIEVGPRDGLQNIKTWIPTEVKLEIIDKLVASGIKAVEVTSFVSPKAVPQMADAVDIMRETRKKYGGDVKLIAIALNLVGVQRAIEAKVDQITFVVSASERHNQENSRQSIEQSLATFRSVCRIKGGTRIQLNIATAFTCPFIGNVDPAAVERIIAEALASGADQVGIADTIGTATPLQVDTLLERVRQVYPDYPFILHIHDTRGMGLANTVTAMNRGITRFETSVGGLGGCPFAPGAAGNIATEDLVNMLQAMHISTGINLPRLLATVHRVQELIPATLNGHMVNAKIFDYEK